MCNWTSTNKTRFCNRNNLNGSNYCLFHKPNKTNEESNLFWKIINWNKFGLLNSDELNYILFNNRDNTNQTLDSIIKEKIERCILSNYTTDERSRIDFVDYRKSIEEQVNNSGIWTDMQSKADFSGFVFPQYKNSFFNYSTLSRYDWGAYDFSEATFECDISFERYIFTFDIYFDKCVFNQTVRFAEAKFIRKVSFKETKFNGPGSYGMKMFENVEFSGRTVLFENISPCNLEFEGAIFGHHTVFELKGIGYSKLQHVASYGENAYRIAKIQSNHIGDYDKATEYSYLEKCYKGYQILPIPFIWDKSLKWNHKLVLFENLKQDKNYLKVFKKLKDLIFCHTFGYGDKPKNAFITIVLLIAIFSCIYMFTGIELKNSKINYDFQIGANIFDFDFLKECIWDYGQCFYFSLVTFSTVGYGDITSATGSGKIISGIEILLGITYIGIWTASLLKKFMK